MPRGLQWLLNAQEPRRLVVRPLGCQPRLRHRAVVPALIAADIITGCLMPMPTLGVPVRWLEEHQNPDGGWGEDLRSYADPAWHGHGASTASQTAWALLALLATDANTTAVDRGIAWLIETQRPDGGWDEELYTGTGFPGDFYINYAMYRLVFPLSALGRYGRRTRQST